MTALERAVKKGGGPSKVAKSLGLEQPVVSNWLARKKLPAERVLDVERVTGVPRHELRPDLYPRPEQVA